MKEEEAAALDQVQADLPAALREANWIWCQGEAVPENFYLYCRKSVTLDDMPAHATVHVTADSRYKFFINGQFVGRGPAPATSDTSTTTRSTWLRFFSQARMSSAPSYTSTDQAPIATPSVAEACSSERNSSGTMAEHRRFAPTIRGVCCPR